MMTKMMMMIKISPSVSSLTSSRILSSSTGSVHPSTMLDNWAVHEDALERRFRGLGHLSITCDPIKHEGDGDENVGDDDGGDDDDDDDDALFVVLRATT